MSICEHNCGYTLCSGKVMLIIKNIKIFIFNFSREVNSITQYPENLCPSFTDITTDQDKNEGWLIKKRSDKSYQFHA